MIRVNPSTYKIRVGKEWYISNKILSNRAADDLTGHASRVWLATLVDVTEQGSAKEVNEDASRSAVEKSEQGDGEKKSKTVVIKDSWPGLRTTLEHEVQELLLFRVPKELHDMLKKHLFTIRSHENMQIDGKGDNTLDTILHGLDVESLGMLQIQLPVKKECGYAKLST